MTKYIEIDGIGEVVPRSEYDALAAQVEVLITAEPEWAKLGAILGEKQANAFKLQREQHLAEIRAEAIHEAIEYATENYGEVFISELVEYADSIRKGGAK